MGAARWLLTRHRPEYRMRRSGVGRQSNYQTSWAYRSKFSAPVDQPNLWLQVHFVALSDRRLLTMVRAKQTDSHIWLYGKSSNPICLLTHKFRSNLHGCIHFWQKTRTKQSHSADNKYINTHSLIIEAGRSHTGHLTRLSKLGNIVLGFIPQPSSQPTLSNSRSICSPS